MPWTSSVYFGTLLIWSRLKTMEAETTIPDAWYDGENEYLLDSYDFGTDQPAATPAYDKITNMEDWHFAYNGSTIRINKYSPLMSEEQRAIVWPMGLRGIDQYGRVSQETYCMGVLVHPEILMTLCACVNSWTRSYDNLLPEQATDEAFVVSGTSDEDYDIRNPTLFALRTNWLGYKNLSGDQDRYTILRKVLQFRPCMTAIESDNVTTAFGQFKTVAFLQLSSPARHPVSGLEFYIDSFTRADWTYWSKGYYDVHDYVHKLNLPSTKDRTNFGPYDAYSYFQRVQDFAQGDQSYRPATLLSATNESMDTALQLLGVGLKEVFPSAGKPPASCQFNVLYRHIYDQIALRADDLAFVDNLFTQWLSNLPNVGCFVRLSPIPLCDVAPGSPVVSGGKIYGFVMSHPSQCTDSSQEYAMFVLVFTEEGGFGPEIENAIKNIGGELDDIRRREDEALINPEDLDGTEPVVDFVGHLDGEVVPDMAEQLIKNYIGTIEPFTDATTAKPPDYDEAQFEGGAEVYFDPSVKSSARVEGLTSILILFVNCRTFVLAFT